jgi:hypothetical protein
MSPELGIAQIPPPLQGRGRGWGLSALRKSIYPAPASLPVAPAQAGAYRACRRNFYSIGPDPKFTNIYAKRGISVNLWLSCDVGLPATKAGVVFNMFKEPVAQQARD